MDPSLLSSFCVYIMCLTNPPPPPSTVTSPHRSLPRRCPSPAARRMHFSSSRCMRTTTPRWTPGTPARHSCPGAGFDHLPSSGVCQPTSMEPNVFCRAQHFLFQLRSPASPNPPRMGIRSGRRRVWDRPPPGRHRRPPVRHPPCPGLRRRGPPLRRRTSGGTCVCDPGIAYRSRGLSFLPTQQVNMSSYNTMGWNHVFRAHISLYK